MKLEIKTHDELYGQFVRLVEHGEKYEGFLKDIGNKQWISTKSSKAWIRDKRKSNEMWRKEGNELFNELESEIEKKEGERKIYKIFMELKCTW